MSDADFESETPQEPTRVDTKNAPKALNNPNLRLYFAGQIVSLIGTWMQQMALSWMVYRLTNSSYMLGLVGFASQAPTFLITPFGGIIADRVNRKKLVLITQTLAMIQATALAWLSFSENPQIEHLIALGAFMGLINAIDLPTRQTFLVDMLSSREELPNAIAVNSSIVTLTRLIGPALAGIFIAWAGERMCFVANAVSYVAVIIALIFVKAKQKEFVGVRPNAILQLKEGFQYAFSFGPIRALLVMIAAVSLFCMPYSVLMTAFAKDVFHGDATTLGVLTTGSGVGSLIGAVYLSSRKGVLGLGRWIVISCLLFGAGLIGFGLTSNLWIALPMLAVAGFGSMILMAASNTILQTLVDEDKRGRVMSIYTMCFMGLAPFGSVVAGWLSTNMGLGKTVLASGAFAVVISVGFATKLRKIRQEARPVYIERGILVAEADMKVMNS
jgi:MFS family permease